jgi:Xaa-Pro aminopeptidase
MIRPLLTLEGCRLRQGRILRAMQKSNWDYFLTGNPRTVYSLTSVLVPLEHPLLFLLRADGHSVLVSPSCSDAAVDMHLAVSVYSPAKPIVDAMLDAGKLLAEQLPARKGRMGVELSYTPATAVAALGEKVLVEDASALVLQTGRAKDPDELEEIRRGLALNTIAYDAAKKVIRPGLSELELHSAMSLAVADELGTAIPLAGDFSCGLRSLKEGGAPTARVIQENELCVLDLFISPAYYAGDTCRTFCAGVPDAAQLEAWTLVRDTLVTAQEQLRPGIAARTFYRSVKDTLDSHPITQGSFWHHAGHGIGYRGHEAPRLVPESPDVIQEGDVIAVEPGIYVESLRGGLRLENCYYIGAEGPTNLFHYPLTMDLL